MTKDCLSNIDLMDRLINFAKEIRSLKALTGVKGKPFISCHWIKFLEDDPVFVHFLYENRKALEHLAGASLFPEEEELEQLKKSKLVVRRKCIKWDIVCM